MRVLMVSLIAVCLMAGTSFATEAKEKSSQVQTQEIVGTIVSVDPQNSSFDLAYEADDQTHEKQTTTFYVTDITTIDIMMAKGTLNDLKEGQNVLLEFAQMPDGTKVVDSIWVKKS